MERTCLDHDPRPQWLTPARVYASADFAGLERKLRVVGRNLQGGGTQTTWIQLQGPRTYVLIAGSRGEYSPGQRYVAEAPLPEQLLPGKYTVAVSRDRRNWVRLPEQQLDVRPDPSVLTSFDLSAARFGGCKPDDGVDDTSCFSQALEAARQAGGGVVNVPKGKWDISTASLPKERQRDGLIVARNVHLRGEGPSASSVIRHGVREIPAPGALFTLVGDNSVVGISFTDAERYESVQESRPVIQLGLPPEPAASGGASQTVSDVIISGNTFNRVGRGARRRWPPDPSPLRDTQRIWRL